MPYLLRKKVDGSTAEQWELANKPLVFGRGEQTDVRIADERLSRQHFAIAPRDNGYVIQDLKSMNGTWVNNAPISEVVLQPNDRIRAGQSIFVFVADRPKGLATIMGEVESEGKGLRTFIGELNAKENKPSI
jgi:pSer/pThr/pTyr-binding forkhead associated (FHA) protein